MMPSLSHERRTTVWFFFALIAICGHPNSFGSAFSLFSTTTSTPSHKRRSIVDQPNHDPTTTIVDNDESTRIIPTATPSRVMDRRQCLTTAATVSSLLLPLLSHPQSALADDAVDDSVLSIDALIADLETEILVAPSKDVKKFFAEARALESQGNLAAAQRLYNRIVQVEPTFVYGWSQLGNTQTALQDLAAAETSYTTAIQLGVEQNRRVDAGLISARKCNDLYILYLNRGSLRLNYKNQWTAALADLRQADALRARPDAVILQNLARAKELNGLYSQADRDYTTAISMTANEVNPFWLRAAMIKLQINDAQSALDLVKRVDVRFAEAPEVRAAYAVILSRRGDEVGARRKFLEIPDRARLKYSDDAYLTQVIAWPPVMREELNKIAVAVGDRK